MPWLYRCFETGKRGRAIAVAASNVFGMGNWCFVDTRMFKKILDLVWEIAKMCSYKFVFRFVIASD